MHEYLFDVKLFASVRIKAASLADARAIVLALDGASVFFDDGIIGEASVDGDAELMDVDGMSPNLSTSSGSQSDAT